MEGFVAVCRSGTLEPGRPLEAEIEGTSIIVVETDTGPHALQGRCSHAGARLADGRVRGFELECPLHGARFDVRTGEVCRGPARERLRTFETRVVADVIEVSVR